MRNTFIKTSFVGILIFAAIMISGTFSGCKSADDPNVPVAPAISGTFYITKIETTADTGKTWTPADAGCKTSATYTFNSPNILIYTKSTCNADADFTGTWTYGSISKELTLNLSNGNLVLDGIVKDANGTTFVLDESAILNAKIFERITFTKK